MHHVVNTYINVMCAEKQIPLMGHSLIPMSIGAIEGANIKVNRAHGARLPPLEVSFSGVRGAS